MMLLPERLQAWLHEVHLRHFISNAIDGLHLAAFYARYDKDGARNQPLHPAMTANVLVYGYVTRVSTTLRYRPATTAIFHCASALANLPASTAATATAGRTAVSGQIGNVGIAASISIR